MEDLGYVYLHYDLLDKEAITTITLKVKLPHVEMYEQHLQKDMFVIVNFFCIDSKFKKGFEKGSMHVVITIESTIELCHQFLHSNQINSHVFPHRFD
jgi:hypothetical protein